MPKVNVSDEIFYYITLDDFDKLVSEPTLSEDDIKFHEAPNLKKLLSEFGYQFLRRNFYETLERME